MAAKKEEKLQPRFCPLCGGKRIAVGGYRDYAVIICPVCEHETEMRFSPAWADDVINLRKGLVERSKQQE